MLTRFANRAAAGSKLSLTLYEMGKQKEAIEFAKKTFDETIEQMEYMNDEEYKDNSLELSVLRDNYTLWKKELVWHTTHTTINVIILFYSGRGRFYMNKAGTSLALTLLVTSVIIATLVAIH